MTPVTLLLVLVTVSGVYAVGRSLRLAPLTNEFPVTTLLATLLAGVVAIASIGARGASGWSAPPAAVVVAALVLGLVYVFGPVLAIALVRAGAWRQGELMVKLMYRTEGGRHAVGRLLAQAALQSGDPVAARALPHGDAPLVVAQALRLDRDWHGVLAVEPNVPSGVHRDSTAAAAGIGGGSDSGAVGNESMLAEARIEALIELGRLDEAQRELRQLAAAFESSPSAQTPLAFRSLTLSHARLAAAVGDLERVRQLLQQPMVGAGPATLYGILGRAADRAGATGDAITFYSRAVAEARGRPKGFYEAEVVRLGGTVPPQSRMRTGKAPVTLALVAVLAAAYGGQVLIDRTRGLVVALGQYFDPSTLIAAYVQGLPGVPAADAWWRYLSYAFVHGNLVHVGFNLWVLFDIGRMYERRRAWGDLMAAFVVGTAGGALLTSVMQAGQPLILVGASGGVLGVAGALLADAVFNRSGTDMALVRSLLQWMALILLFSVLPGVSLWGHAGGVAAGFLYGLVRGRLPGRLPGTLFGAMAAVTLIVAIVTSITTIVPLLP